MARPGGIGPWGRNMRHEAWEDIPVNSAAAKSTKSPNYDLPGYNLPGSGNEQTPPSEEGRATPGAGGWAPNPGGSSSDDPTEEIPPFRMGQNPTSSSRSGSRAAGEARAAEWRSMRANPPAAPVWDVGEALYAAHPALPGVVYGTMAAFRGQRTTQTYSLAHEQNLYGGVQRDTIPTERISTWNRSGPTPTQTRRGREREMLDYQELTLPEAGHVGAVNQSPGAGSPIPLYTGEHSDPFGAQERTPDPLFERNVGRQMSVNPAQFGVHDRTVSGL